jgi:hypothetical protein
MRLVWVSVIGLVFIATAFLLRGSMSAHAEKYDGPIKWTYSNVEKKGDRLAVRELSEPRPVSALVPLVRPTQTKPSELSEPSDTVSWHWRQGAKTITKVSSNGKRTQIPRARLARRD